MDPIAEALLSSRTEAARIRLRHLVETKGRASLRDLDRAGIRNAELKRATIKAAVAEGWLTVEVVRGVGRPRVDLVMRK